MDENKYKKPKSKLVVYLMGDIFLGLFTMFCIYAGIATSKISMFVIGFFGFAFFAAMVWATCKALKSYKRILYFMQEDMYVLCSDFRNYKEKCTSRDDDGFTHTIYYSVTEVTVTFRDGTIKKLKSEAYSLGKNPFEDGRTEIKVFIDIDDLNSPYYLYPY